MYEGYRIAVIIPALNEAETIGSVLSSIDRSVVDDVVVGDNGSTDGTSQIAVNAGAKVVREERRGYGSACLRAVAVVPDADVLVFLDADGSDDPTELPLLLAALVGRRSGSAGRDPGRVGRGSEGRLRDGIAGEAEPGADLVIGSRVAGVAEPGADLVIGSRVTGVAEPGALTPLQRFGNVMTCVLVHRLWGVRYTDLGPFRAIWRTKYEELDMSDPDFGWTIEMQVKAAQKGFRTVEVPVSYRTRRGGRSKVSGTIQGSFAAGRRILGYVFRAKVRDLRGRM